MYFTSDYSHRVWLLLFWNKCTFEENLSRCVLFSYWLSGRTFFLILHLSGFDALFPVACSKFSCDKVGTAMRFFPQFLVSMNSRIFKTELTLCSFAPSCEVVVYFHWVFKHFAMLQLNETKLLMLLVVLFFKVE